MHLTGYRTHQIIHRARRDHADKDWLHQDADDEKRAQQMLGGMLAVLAFWLIGTFFGLAAYDWTQGGEWTQAMVERIYALAPQ